MKEVPKSCGRWRCSLLEIFQKIPVTAACSRQSCKPHSAFGMGILMFRYSLQDALQGKPCKEGFWASGINGKMSALGLGRRLLLLSDRGAGKPTGKWVSVLKGTWGRFPTPQSSADFIWDEWIATVWVDPSEDQCTGNQGKADYLQFLHPSRIVGTFGVESCRAGLFLPTKPLLGLCCACSAMRNSSTGGWMDCVRPPC